MSRILEVGEGVVEVEVHQRQRHPPWAATISITRSWIGWLRIPKDQGIDVGKTHGDSATAGGGRKSLIELSQTQDNEITNLSSRRMPPVPRAHAG